MEQLTKAASAATQNDELNTMMNRAAGFWKFLEDLATNDPAAYQEFMYKQRNAHKKMFESKLNQNQNGDECLDFDAFDQNVEDAGKRLNDTKNGKIDEKNNKNRIFFSPTPMFVIKTKLCSLTKNVIDTLTNINDYTNLMQNGQKLFINFLCSPYSKPLQSKSNANAKVTDSTPISDILVPILLSKIFYENDENNKFWRYDIIYHNSVYDRFDENDKKKLLFKKWVIEYAFRNIEKQNKFKLNRQYKTLKRKKFIGKTPPDPQFIGDKHKKKGKEKEKKEREQRVVDDEKKIQEKECDEFKFEMKTRKQSENENENDGGLLLREVEMKKIQIPKYKMNLDKNVIRLEIELPKEKNIENIILDMNETELILESPHYRLEITFFKKVDASAIKAKFDKNKHCLKLKVPIKA